MYSMNARAGARMGGGGGMWANAAAAEGAEMADVAAVPQAATEKSQNKAPRVRSDFRETWLWLEEIIGYILVDCKKTLSKFKNFLLQGKIKHFLFFTATDTSFEVTRLIHSQSAPKS